MTLPSPLDVATAPQESGASLTARPICFIDFDHTVARINSAVWFLVFLKAVVPLRAPGLRRLRLGYTTYEAGDDYATTQGLARLFQGMDARRIRAAARLFRRVVMARIIPETLALLQRYASSHELVIISASVDVVLEPVLEEIALRYGLRMERISNTLEEKDGRFTGRLLEHVYSNRKHHLASARAARNGVSLERCAFVTDHITDVLLLLAVGTREVMRPKDDLHLIASRQGWRIHPTAWPRSDSPQAPSRPQGELSIALIGYLGLYNSGADLRARHIISELIRQLGSTPFTLHVYSLDCSPAYRRRLTLDSRVRFHEIRPLTVRKTILRDFAGHDAFINVEGAPLYEMVGQAMLDIFLDVALYASLTDRPALFFASDCMRFEKPENEAKARRILALPHVRFVTRSAASSAHLARLGVDVFAHGVDVAWVERLESPRAAGARAPGRLRVAYACRNLFHHPSEVELDGSRLAAAELFWQYPLFYSYRQSYRAPVDPAVSKAQYARFVGELVSTLESLPDSEVTLFSFEKMDHHDAERINAVRRERGLPPWRIVDSRDAPPEELLEQFARDYDVVVGGRFHANVYGLITGKAVVPFTHDERFLEFHGYKGAPPIHPLEPKAPGFFDALRAALEAIRVAPSAVDTSEFDERLAEGLAVNREALGRFLEEVRELAARRRP